MNLIVVFSGKYRWPEHYFFVWSLGNFQKLLKTNQFLVSTTFFIIMNTSVFSLRLESSPKKSNKSGKMQYVWQLVLFSFCCALTTGRCYAFQHKLVNYKKSEFYGPYVQIILFLVIMVNVCLIKLLKKHNHKKSNCVFFTTFKTFKSSSFCNIFNFHSGFV